MAERDSVPSFDSEAGLFTYPQIQHLLKIEFSRARRYGYPLSACVFQVDRLDLLREVHGYGVRDRILDRVVALVHQNSRTSDFLGKVGERFVLLLPHTDRSGVETLMERVRTRLKELSFEIDGRPIRVTMSAGASTFEGKNTIFFDSILKGAEEGLRLASEGGGDAVRIVGT